LDRFLTKLSALKLAEQVLFWITLVH